MLRIIRIRLQKNSMRKSFLAIRSATSAAQKFYVWLESLAAISPATV